MSNFIRSSSCRRSSRRSRPFVISILGVRSAKRVLHKISTIQHPTKSTAMTNVNRILNYPRIWLAGKERTQQRTYRGLHLHDLEPSVELGHKVRGTRKCYSATKPHHRVGFLWRPSRNGLPCIHWSVTDTPNRQNRHTWKFIAKVNTCWDSPRR